MKHEHPSQTKVYMFNALWFAPDGGAAKYSQYLQAIAPLLQKYGGQPVAAYTPLEAVEGDFDADMFGVVEWPSREAFQQFFNDPAYRQIAHQREEALAKAYLVMAEQLSLTPTNE